MPNGLVYQRYESDLINTGTATVNIRPLDPSVQHTDVGHERVNIQEDVGITESNFYLRPVFEFLEEPMPPNVSELTPELIYQVFNQLLLKLNAMKDRIESLEMAAEPSRLERAIPRPSISNWATFTINR